MAKLTQEDMAELLQDIAAESETRSVEDYAGLCYWLTRSLYYLENEGRNAFDEVSRLMYTLSTPMDDETSEREQWMWVAGVQQKVVRKIRETADGLPRPVDAAWYFGTAVTEANYEHRMTFLALMMTMNETGDLL